MSSQIDASIPVFSSLIGSWQISVRRSPLETFDRARRYDQLAPKWSRLTEGSGYRRAYARLLTRFIAEGNLRPSVHTLRVLDCGVGTGAFALEFCAGVGCLRLHRCGRCNRRND